MSFSQVTVVGTGLIGGSFVLALRAHGYAGRIVGCDRQQVLDRALALGAIDAGLTDPCEAVYGSDLVVLAAPVGAILDLIGPIAKVVSPTALITDVGSTKREICARARLVFGPDAAWRFLPGHPLAGSERSGIEQAAPDLFDGAAWLLTPLPGQDLQLDARCAGFVNLLATIGARVIQIDAEHHDLACAWTSHLPQMLSTALAAVLAPVEDNLRAELGPDFALDNICGRGLRDMTRLASSPYFLWRDIAFTNTENLAQALFLLEQRLSHLRANLRSPELRAEFERAAGFARAVSRPGPKKQS